MNDDPVFGLLVVLVALINILVLYIIHRRCKSQISKWALKNSFRIVDCKRTVGSLINVFSKKRIYNIVVEDRDGFIKTGTVYVGGTFMGLLSTSFEVRWD